MSNGLSATGVSKPDLKLGQKKAKIGQKMSNGLSATGVGRLNLKLGLPATV